MEQQDGVGVSTGYLRFAEDEVRDLVDVVLQPVANSPPDNVMMNDMGCRCTMGQMRVAHTPGGEFIAKEGHVWSCTKGIQEQV